MIMKNNEHNTNENTVQYSIVNLYNAFVKKMFYTLILIGHQFSQISIENVKYCNVQYQNYLNK